MTKSVVSCILNSMTDDTSKGDCLMGAVSFQEYPLKQVLRLLLTDKTTQENIIFATDGYESLGEEYSAKNQITVEKITNPDFALLRRFDKDASQQQGRTRVNAEVMTPAWVINKMVSHADEEWFGRPEVFNVQNDDHTWSVKTQEIRFPKGKTWQEYVESRRIEITCGEAPYIVSRYDTTTGEEIQIKNRIGMLDRKLRIVGENTDSESEWMKWAICAFQSVYGYEFQGDNLLLARINLLLTFVEYLDAKWHRKPTNPELRKIANIISWNIWQMDGLTKTIPYSKKQEAEQQGFLDMFFETEMQKDKEKMSPPCRIYDWRANKSIAFDQINYTV